MHTIRITRKASGFPSRQRRSSRRRHRLKWPDGRRSSRSTVMVSKSVEDLIVEIYGPETLSASEELL